MPGSTTPPPPMVVDHADMMAFAKNVEDSILVTMDFEGVDHLQAEKGKPQPSNYQKMSEVGIAVYDPRDRTANTNQSRVEDLGELIRAHHTIIQKYRRYTEETCPAFYHRQAHREPGKAHHARPYHSKFARSIFRTAEEAMRDIKQLIGELLHQNRTMSEVQDGAERKICVLFWAAGMEEDILREAGIDLASMSSQIKVWDMQIWSVFQIRFTRTQTKGEMAFGSLGALGNSSTLHNATNDTVAEMLSLLKLLHMTEEEWKAWHVERVELPAMSMAWVNPSIYRDNFNSRPRTLHAPVYTQPTQKNNHTNNRPAAKPTTNHSSFTTQAPQKNNHTNNRPCAAKPTTNHSSFTTQAPQKNNHTNNRPAAKPTPNHSSFTTQAPQKNTSIQANNRPAAKPTPNHSSFTNQPPQKNVQANKRPAAKSNPSHNSFSNQAAPTPGVQRMAPSSNSVKVEKGKKPDSKENAPVSIGDTATDQWWAAYEARKSKISSVMAAYKKPTAAAASSTARRC